MQASAGYLVVAGTAVQIWDVQTAQLLHTLRSPAQQELWLLQQQRQRAAALGGWHAGGGGGGGDSDDDDDAAGFFEGLDEELAAAQHQEQQQAGAQQDGGAAAGREAPFTSVSYSGHLLAAGEAGGLSRTAAARPGFCSRLAERDVAGSVRVREGRSSSLGACTLSLVGRDGSAQRRRP